MIQEFWVRTLSKAAWKDFAQHAMPWMLLAAGAVALMAADLVLPAYLQEYQLIFAVAMILVGALYTTILHQNGLDAAYGRPLSMLRLSPSIFFASLFFVAISLYNPFPQYNDLLAAFFPALADWIMVLNWIVHAIITYFLVRCMFVGMVLLEDKCNIVCAFKKSFAMTHHHFIGLFGVFLYLALVLALSAMTIVGYFVALPYAMIMKSLVFKELHKNLQK